MHSEIATSAFVIAPAAGYVLAEDVAAIIERAGEHWDRLVGAAL